MVCIDIILTNLRIFLSCRTFSHFLTFFQKKAQHNFIKTRGGGQRPFIRLIKNRRFFRKTSLKRPISEGRNFLGQNFRSEFSRPVTALEKVVFTVWDAVRSAICRGEECCLRRMRWKIFRCIFHISPISCDLDYSLQLQFCAFFTQLVSQIVTQQSLPTTRITSIFYFLRS